MCSLSIIIDCTPFGRDGSADVQKDSDGKLWFNSPPQRVAYGNGTRFWDQRSGRSAKRNRLRRDNLVGEGQNFETDELRRHTLREGVPRSSFFRALEDVVEARIPQSL